MSNLTLHLRIVGVSMLVLAVAHIYFGRRFDWKNDLAKLSLINRQMFLVHAFFICLILAMIGTLILICPDSLLVPSPLGRLVLIGLVVFWSARLIFQWFIYDASLWRGHRTNTIAHILFTILWAYYTFIFAVALRHQYGG